MDNLCSRQQRVVLNEQTSTREKTLASVPQGSLLVPPFFLIYINDTPEEFKIFADDTSFFQLLKNTNFLKIT